jgi:hypothetical protein
MTTSIFSSPEILKLAGVEREASRKDLEAFSDREWRWLWVYWVSRGAHLEPGTFANSTTRISALTQAIDLNDQVNLLDVLTTKGRMLLPSETLKWIESSDKRLMKWLPVRLKIEGCERHTIQPSSLTHYESLITQIDCWNIELPQKKQIIDNLKEDWWSIRAQDRLFDWFDQESEEQGRWIWNYLLKHGIRHSDDPAPSPKNYHDESKHYLDLSGLSLQNKTFFLKQMERSWGQKSYRRNLQDRGQYNFILKHETSNKLTELAKSKGKKRHEMLEELINKASGI